MQTGQAHSQLQPYQSTLSQSLSSPAISICIVLRVHSELVSSLKFPNRPISEEAYEELAVKASTPAEGRCLP